MTATFLIDEMIPAFVAKALRDRGLDVAAITERAECRGSSDAEVLDLAMREGRVVVTFDRQDFLKLDRDAAATGRRHNGIVIVSARRHSQSRAAMARFVDELTTLAESGRQLHGYVSWL